MNFWLSIVAINFAKNFAPVHFSDSEKEVEKKKEEINMIPLVVLLLATIAYAIYTVYIFYVGEPSIVDVIFSFILYIGVILFWFVFMILSEWS